jgi:uncharacterized protein involved in type VI secretion and phage assembly
MMRSIEIKLLRQTVGAAALEIHKNFYNYMNPSHGRTAVLRKYRGIVTDTLDPLGVCRIRVKVPSVYGDRESSWANPCLPFADKDVAMKHVPPVGSFVWIEFENGDSNFPIWTGCFYSSPS